MAVDETLVIWCGVQAAVVACCGIAAAWLLSKRAPAAAATASAAAAATILVLTCSAPAPLPAFNFLAADDASIAFDGQTVATPAGDGHGVTARGREGGLDVRAAVAWIRSSVLGGRAKPRAAEGGWPWILIGAAGGAVVGLARLAWALRYVLRLRRSAKPVVDSEAVKQFEETARALGVRRAVRLCETELIRSPAMIGWLRPVVLLPVERGGWSGEQVRAAVAHELAHVVRGDFGWRTAASLATAIHFLNPLVHVLTRRLALAQELAADRVASAATGGAASYLRAISELAIRLDDIKGLRAEPLVLPTFSSGLLRRITMLRSMEGSTTGRGRPLAGLVAASLIALVGAGSMALRGAAETVEPTPGGTPATAQMFARAPLDVSAMFPGNHAVCVVRIHELAQRSAFAPLIQLGNSMLSQQWQAVFKGDAPPTLRLETIESVAGAIKWESTSRVDAEGNHKSSESISIEEFVIRFVDDVKWRLWIEKHIPGGEQIEDEEFKYVKLPKFQGNVHLLVTERDARTLVIAGSVERLRELAAGGGDDDASLSQSLASVDGGLATLAVDAVAAGFEKRLEGATYTTDDAAAISAVQVMSRNVRRFGVGFDLDVASNESALQVSLGCANQASAEELRAALGTILPLFKTALQAARANSVPGPAGGDGQTLPGMVRTAGEDDTAEQGAAWYLGLIQSAELRLEPRDDGMVDVRIECAAPFPSTVLTAYRRADDAEAGETERR